MAKRRKNNLDKVGRYSFFIGVILAILAGLFTNWISTSILVILLGLLGLIVGLLNITARENTDFLVAVIALMLAGSAGVFGTIPSVGAYISAILFNIVIFIVPAALIVSLKAIWNLAERR